MKRYIFTALCVCPLLAHADIYKAVDAEGRVTYSNTPIKGGKKINLEPLPTMKPVLPTSSGFPRVDSETQKGRDDTRRKILQDELDAEQKLLEVAQNQFTEAESNPEVFKGKDGKTFRNVAKFDEKMKPLQEQVDLHKNNIEALKTELSKLKDMPIITTPVQRKPEANLN